MIFGPCVKLLVFYQKHNKLSRRTKNGLEPETFHESSDIYRIHKIFKQMHSRVEDPESNQQALTFQVRGLILFEPEGGDDAATGTWFAANLHFFTVINRV